MRLERVQAHNCQGYTVVYVPSPEKRRKKCRSKNVSFTGVDEWDRVGF